MAQTTGAMNTVDGQIWVSANGTTWIDISGSTNRLVPTPQRAATGSAATLDGQYRIGTAGKLEPFELTISTLYTEVAGEAFRTLEAQWNLASRPLYVRWNPSRGAAGFVFETANAAGTSAAGTLIEFNVPGADAETPSPTMLDFKVWVTRVIRSVNQPSASQSPSASASPSPSAG